MAPQVFVAGPASWNTLVYLDRLPESRPHMVRARSHTSTLGGTSAGKALNLAALGASVTLRTLVGTDPEAVSILQRLDRDEIDVIAETADGASEQHLNLMTAAGERLSIYLDVPELITEQYAERTLAALDACDLAVIDLAEHSRALLAEARRRGTRVWCDIHDYNGTDRFHRDFIEAADVLFLNDDGLEQPVPFMRERVLAGTSTVVCTQGAAGATAVTAAGTVHVPAPPVTDIVDTNGAGDAFLAGFLIADQQGLDTERCLKAGHAQAALCLRVPDLAPAARDFTLSPSGSPVRRTGQTSSYVRRVSENPDIDPDSASASQAQIDGEMARISDDYERSGAEETQPRLDYPPYRSSLLRHPTKDLHHADPETIELFAPVFGHRDVGGPEADLTIQHHGEPVGERIVVTGRVLDGDGRPVRHQLVEIWQANAAGRYIHKRDQHPAPIDPNFTGVGRVLTDGDGVYTFTTIKPGPYPWKNHRNAWRPAHIHFSLFGTEFTQRMATQMYFPGDPLFSLDPIYQSIVDPLARERLVATYDHDVTQHEWATGYRWDIVLTGTHRTPMEEEEHPA